MNREQRMLVGAVAIALFAFSLSFASPTPLVSADWQVINNGSFTRDLLGYTYFGWSGLTTNHRIRFNWVSGIIPVSFYIVDYANLQEAIAGHTFYAAVVHESNTGRDVSWQVTSAGSWYGLWVGTLTQVACDYYLYIWSDPYGAMVLLLLVGGGIAAVVIVAVVVAVVVLKRRKPAESA